MTTRITSSPLFAVVLPFALGGAAQGASLTYDADLGTAGAQDGSGSGWNTTAAASSWRMKKAVPHFQYVPFATDRKVPLPSS